jgi:hypothetical protein
VTKRLTKQEASKLKGQAALEYAAFLMHEAGERLDAEAASAQALRDLAYRAESMRVAAIENAEQARLDALLDAKMHTITTSSGAVIDQSSAERGVIERGASQFFGVLVPKRGDR